MKLWKASVCVAALASLSGFAGQVHADSSSTSGATQTYVVLYKEQAVGSDAASVINKAGGSLVASYPQIGVVIATSSSTSFRANLMKNSKVQGAAATAKFGVGLGDDIASDDTTTPLPDSAPAGNSDTLTGLQWDMVQIHTPEAHAITGGSPSVLVGDIDTGLDFTHPDLAANYDAANSADCLSGAPTPLLPGNDVDGHGTHTAGTIAAAANGIGIVGVAPNIRIAGIKAGNDDGFFFPEAVVCAFMWAGSHHMQVTNNSYFADPWLFNCKNDPDQRAIWQAERRAISWSQSQGVLNVAAMGNQADDLAHPTQDATSPDDTTPVTRDITNACAVVPVEVAGVVGVAATGNKGQKSFYASYGMGVTAVTAPGGDSRQLTASAPNGRVLSTYPAAAMAGCARKVFDPSGATYCYLQGTSMASPHAAGLAALIFSQGIQSPGAVAAMLQSTADPLACPTDMSIYATFPALDGGAPQVCTGGPAYNSFNGHGQINALSAVS